MMAKPWQQDKQWEESYHGQVLSILGVLTPHLAEIRVASLEKDRANATDFEVTLSGGTIAVRLRRWGCKFRDLTIRAQRDSGAKTELAKIKEGYAYRYFYGWEDQNRKIAEWILVNLDKVRETGLLEKQRKLWPNGDGTYFISIDLRELYDAGCLITYQINRQQRQVNPSVTLEEGIERAKRVKRYDPRTE
jgi:hypothetical protein